MYDLRGSAGSACPECGVELNREGLSRSSIPWVYRERLRWVEPMLRTCWRASFKTRAFCYEVARPVSMDDALAFRRRVVGVLTLAAVGVLVVFLSLAQEFIAIRENESPAMTQMLLLGTGGVLLLWLFLFAFTGVHTYWLHPGSLTEEQQRRAVAIGYYACAPLVLLALPMLGLPFSIFLSEIAGDTQSVITDSFANALFYGSILLSVFVLVVYLALCLSVARFAARRGALAQGVMAFTLVGSWIGLAGLVFLVLPAIGLYLYVIFGTF